MLQFVVLVVVGEQRLQLSLLQFFGVGING